MSERARVRRRSTSLKHVDWRSFSAGAGGRAAERLAEVSQLVVAWRRQGPLGTNGVESSDDDDDAADADQPPAVEAAVAAAVAAADVVQRGGGCEFQDNTDFADVGDMDLMRSGLDMRGCCDYCAELGNRCVVAVYSSSADQPPNACWIKASATKPVRV